MAATLVAAGSTAAGVQPAGITQQYQKSGTASAVITSTAITGRDSGNILGTVPPGKPGLKQTDGTIQRSARIKADGTAGAVGNALVCTSGKGLIPTPPTGSLASDGLSQAPQHE